MELEINTLTDVEMRQIKIPPLLLQPYVENAFWHGLIPSGKTNKQLSIQVSRKNENIEISIKDNGVGRHFEKTDLDKNKFKKEKRGLEIIEERILQFNKSYECKIQSEIKDLINEQRENCGTQVIITITGCINKSN